MNNKLIIIEDSSLDRKLTDMWDATAFGWRQFVKKLDTNITDVKYDNKNTEVLFKSEEHKTWFLLRWA